MAQPPKRQKIEEESATAFFAWYVPSSGHPRRAESEMKQVWFRFPSAWNLYKTLVHRKWHQRWYLINIMKLAPFEMYTFELLRQQGVFVRPKKVLPDLENYWEQ